MNLKEGRNKVWENTENIEWKPDWWSLKETSSLNPGSDKS